MTRFSFETELRGALAVVELHGELDLLATAALESELERLADEPGVDVVALDLRPLDFVDSSGLRVVLLANERLDSNERRLVLVRGSSDVQRVFEITHMAERLDFVASL